MLTAIGCHVISLSNRCGPGWCSSKPCHLLGNSIPPSCVPGFLFLPCQWPSVFYGCKTGVVLAASFRNNFVALVVSQIPLSCMHQCLCLDSIFVGTSLPKGEVNNTVGPQSRLEFCCKMGLGLESSWSSQIKCLKSVAWSPCCSVSRWGSPYGPGEGIQSSNPQSQDWAKKVSRNGLAAQECLLKPDESILLDKCHRKGY